MGRPPSLQCSVGGPILVHTGLSFIHSLMYSVVHGFVSTKCRRLSCCEYRTLYAVPTGSDSLSVVCSVCSQRHDQVFIKQAIGHSTNLDMQVLGWPAQ